MRVVFFGTPAFAVPSLAALIEAGIDIAAVVSQPDRPHARSHSTLVAPPVKIRALAANLPVWQPDRPRGELLYHQLRGIDADLGIVVAYGHVLQPELLAIPRLGLVNVHASLLPRWRGAAPIQRAILAGDTETGVSIMRIEEGLDTGGVWHERRTTITDDDTSGSLAERLAHLGAEALLEALPRIAEGAEPAPQPAEGVTIARKIHRDDAHIAWNESARAVSCRIRAMEPAPGAWTTMQGAELKVFGGTVATEAERGRLPGSIHPTADALVVATGDGAVRLREVQPAGKRRLSAGDWLRGAHLPQDARFE